MARMCKEQANDKDRIMIKSPAQILNPERTVETSEPPAHGHHADFTATRTVQQRSTEELLQQLKRIRRRLAGRPLDQIMKLLRPQRPNARTVTSNNLSHLYGVRSVYHGLLFIQPRNGAGQVCVAGDFNNWNPHRHPMTWDEHRHVWYAVIKASPGQYRYRLVADGRWMEDRHNPSIELNPYGEFNNIAEVKPRGALPTG